jgi:hypothetical protein
MQHKFNTLFHVYRWLAYAAKEEPGKKVKKNAKKRFLPQKYAKLRIYFGF